MQLLRCKQLCSTRFHGMPHPFMYNLNVPILIKDISKCQSIFVSNYITFKKYKKYNSMYNISKIIPNILKIESCVTIFKMIIYFLLCFCPEKKRGIVSVTRCESMEISTLSWYWKIICNSCAWICILTRSFNKTLSHGTMLYNISCKISYWCKISHGAMHHLRDVCVTSIV